jgi:hypothetical protein
MTIIPNTIRFSLANIFTVEWVVEYALRASREDEYRFLGKLHRVGSTLSSLASYLSGWVNLAQCNYTYANCKVNYRWWTNSTWEYTELIRNLAKCLCFHVRYGNVVRVEVRCFKRPELSVRVEKVVGVNFETARAAIESCLIADDYSEIVVTFSLPPEEEMGPFPLSLPPEEDETDPLPF